MRLLDQGRAFTASIRSTTPRTSDRERGSPSLDLPSHTHGLPAPRFDPRLGLAVGSLDVGGLSLADAVTQTTRLDDKAHRGKLLSIGAVVPRTTTPVVGRYERDGTSACLVARQGHTTQARQLALRRALKMPSRDAEPLWSICCSGKSIRLEDVWKDVTVKGALGGAIHPVRRHGPAPEGAAAQLTASSS